MACQGISSEHISLGSFSGPVTCSLPVVSVVNRIRRAS